jgi:hypothetical protein
MAYKQTKKQKKQNERKINTETAFKAKVAEFADSLWHHCDAGSGIECGGGGRMFACTRLVTLLDEIKEPHRLVEVGPIKKVSQKIAGAIGEEAFAKARKIRCSCYKDELGFYCSAACLGMGGWH